MKEIKKVFDIVSKRDCTIYLIFNKDRLVGARIITSLDNWWNLLLKECECASSPAVCSLYFSINEIITQIESGSFYCSLPKVLSIKHEREGILFNLKAEEKGGNANKKVKKENTIIHNT